MTATRKPKRFPRPNIGMLVTKEQLQVGMKIELEWVDVQGMERMTWEDLQALTDPGPTRTWGVIVKKNPESIVVAHEIGDDGSDGCSASIYPCKIIESVRFLGRIDLSGKLKG